MDIRDRLALTVVAACIVVSGAIAAVIIAGLADFVG